MSRGRNTYGASPPSPTAYFVALGGVCMLILALCVYCVYFCCSKIKELSAAELECQQPLPPKSKAPNYPVQPGVREGAQAMAKLCRQLPKYDVETTSPSTHDTSVASHNNDVTSQTYSTCDTSVAQDTSLTSHVTPCRTSNTCTSNEVTSQTCSIHDNDVSMTYDTSVAQDSSLTSHVTPYLASNTCTSIEVTSQTCSIHDNYVSDTSITHDTGLTSHVTHGNGVNSNSNIFSSNEVKSQNNDVITQTYSSCDTNYGTSNVKNTQKTSVSQPDNDDSLKSSVITNDTSVGASKSNINRDTKDVMTEEDVSNDLQFVDDNLVTPENTSKPTLDNKITSEKRNDLESVNISLQNDFNPAYVVNVTSMSARNKFFSPTVYDNNRFLDNRFQTQQKAQSNDVRSIADDVALDGRKVTSSITYQ